MTDKTHSEDCWRWHLECAVAKIERLSAECSELRTLLAEAIKTIRVFHGEAAWDIYCNNAPEMQRFKAAVSGSQLPETCSGCGAPFTACMQDKPECVHLMLKANAADQKQCSDTENERSSSENSDQK